jgi:hypothetical protein
VFREHSWSENGITFWSDALIGPGPGFQIRQTGPGQCALCGLLPSLSIRHSIVLADWEGTDTDPCFLVELSIEACFGTWRHARDVITSWRHTALVLTRHRCAQHLPFFIGGFICMYSVVIYYINPPCFLLDWYLVYLSLVSWVNHIRSGSKVKYWDLVVMHAASAWLIRYLSCTSSIGTWPRARSSRKR